MNTSSPNENLSASQHITDQITQLEGWRGQTLALLRELIHASAPNITEEWKWDTAVFSQNGNVVASGVFKDHIKLNFFKGAFLEDPNSLFNAGLDAKASRGVDFNEGDTIPEEALKELIRSAVAYNLSGSKKK